MSVRKAKIELQAQRIAAEVDRAMELHPPLHSLHEAYAVILEELEEFWERVKVNPKKLNIAEREKRTHDMQSELLQIAAMCVRATVDCDLMG